MGYSPWCHKESDSNKGLTLAFSCYCYKCFEKVKVLKLCLTLCDLMDCRPPGSSVHGILQASILECASGCFVVLIHRVYILCCGPLVFLSLIYIELCPSFYGSWFFIEV